MSLNSLGALTHPTEIVVATIFDALKTAFRVAWTAFKTINDFVDRYQVVVGIGSSLVGAYNYFFAKEAPSPPQNHTAKLVGGVALFAISLGFFYSASACKLTDLRNICEPMAFISSVGCFLCGTYLLYKSLSSMFSD